MISVQEAKAIIYKGITALPAVELLLLEAAHLTLAQDVFSGIDIPAFEQSSMDGYAIRFADKGSPLKITGEMAAGTNQDLSINRGEAARIFTGAPLPDGADTVVMQEKVSVQNNVINILDDGLQLGSNVRNRGAEVKARSLAIPQGTILSPTPMGVLAGIDFTMAWV